MNKGVLSSKWPTKRIKYILEEIKECSETGSELSLSMSQRLGLVPTSMLGNIPNHAASKIGFKICNEGDLVLNRLKAHLGVFAISPSVGLVSPDYAVFRPKNKMVARYFNYLFHSDLYIWMLSKRVTGIAVGLQRLYTDDFFDIHSICPPFGIQEEIADYLDRKTTAIDNLIAKKRRMIKLLEEKRSALINHVVTKGLNPNAPMKDSGVPWIGEVSRVKLNYLVDILPGFAFSSDSYSDNPDDVKLLRGVNVGVNNVRWHSVVYWPHDLTDRIKSYSLRCGDIVVGMDRPWISSGMRIAVVDDEDVPSLLLQRVARIRPGDRLDAGYLVFALRTNLFRRHVEPDTTGISVPHVSGDQIGSFHIPLPEMTEQLQVSRFLKTSEDSIDEMVLSMKSSTDLLNEYRQALITAAVTGKIDVTQDPMSDDPEEAMQAQMDLL